MDLDLHTTEVMCIFNFFSFPCIAFLVVLTSVLICRGHYSLLDNLSCNLLAEGGSWEEAEGFATRIFAPACLHYRMLLFHAHSLVSLSIIRSFHQNGISKPLRKKGLAAIFPLHSCLPKTPFMRSLGIPEDYFRMLFSQYTLSLVIDFLDFLFPVLGLYGIPQKISFLNYSI